MLGDGTNAIYFTRIHVFDLFHRLKKKEIYCEVGEVTKPMVSWRLVQILLRSVDKFSFRNGRYMIFFSFNLFDSKHLMTSWRCMCISRSCRNFVGILGGICAFRPRKCPYLLTHCSCGVSLQHRELLLCWSSHFFPITGCGNFSIFASIPHPNTQFSASSNQHK